MTEEEAASGEHDCYAGDFEVFERGMLVCVVEASSSDVQNWVQMLIDKTGARISWYRENGTASVLHLGDEESLLRICAAIVEIEDKLRGKILR